MTKSVYVLRDIFIIISRKMELLLSNFLFHSTA